MTGMSDDVSLARRSTSCHDFTTTSYHIAIKLAQPQVYRLAKNVRVQAAQTSKFAGDSALTPPRVISSITTTTQRVLGAVEHARQPIGWL
jgi:predicted amino acid dehydrogenase